MKAFILAVISAISVAGLQGSTLNDLMPEFTLVKRLEQLSREKKYGEIFDSLASDYKNDVSRKFWIKRSEELGWTITKASIGTFSQYGDFAAAPVRSETIVGPNVHHVYAVAYFVREGGVWKFWNFPFVVPELVNQTRWPPPFEKGQNQLPLRTPAGAAGQ